MTRTGTSLLLVTLLGCTVPAAEQGDPSLAPAGGERVEGVVRVVGSMPVGVSVVLERDEGKQVQLSGPLREELRALSGARVAVTGAARATGDPSADRQIDVSGYEILSVDGQPVTMGTVEGRTGGWTVLRTPAGGLLYLGGAADQLQPGQKVWVQGQPSLIVQSYGVLRP